jgi:hypothetical protein
MLWAHQDSLEAYKNKNKNKKQDQPQCTTLTAINTNKAILTRLQRH